MSFRRSFIRCCVAFALTWSVLPAGDVATAAPLVLDLGSGVKLELEPIRHGSFTEGSPVGEAGRAENETPRKVTLTHDYYLGKYPVTVGQFKRFVADTHYRTEAEVGTSGGFGFDGTAIVQRKDFTWKNPGFPQTDEHPVVIVTYADATAFTDWLARKTRYKLALPTEAQWEYACRAGSTTRFYFGDSDSDLAAHAWYKANSPGGTKPVGGKKPNAFGLYDMSGNVFEWCRDWSLPRGEAAATDPEASNPGTATPQRRVLRGGSWTRDPKHGRSAARHQSTPGTRNAENGFRLALTTDASGEPLRFGSGSSAAGGAPQLSQPERHVVVSPSPPPEPDTAYEFAESSGLGTSTKMVIGIAVVLAIIVMIFLAKVLGGSSEQPWPPQQQPQQPAQPSGFARGFQAGAGGQYFTHADDGFWFDRLDISPGTLLQMTYLLNGVLHQQRVTTERGPRQFVYTGGKPDDIQIVGSTPPGDDPNDINRPDPYYSDPTPPTPPRSSSSFQGYPAAY